MDFTFGFIGCGSMGGALAAAACKGAGAQNVLLANRTRAKAEKLAAALGCGVCTNAEAAAQSQFLFLGVKPQMMAEMLAEIAPVLAARKDPFVLVSMAAGLSMARIRALAGGSYPVLRLMPNTPVAVGAGMVLYCAADVSPALTESFLAAMAPAGRFDPLPEALIDAGSAVSGCGPAFVCQFLEGLADGAVACGLPRAKALEYAAQTLAGTAQLMLATGQHPGAMKDAVCSPGGSTIQGVRVLEQRALRGACTDAVIAAYDKTKELGKK